MPLQHDIFFLDVLNPLSFVRKTSTFPQRTCSPALLFGQSNATRRFAPSLSQRHNTILILRQNQLCRAMCMVYT